MTLRQCQNQEFPPPSSALYLPTGVCGRNCGLGVVDFLYGGGEVTQAYETSTEALVKSYCCKVCMKSFRAFPSRAEYYQNQSLSIPPTEVFVSARDPQRL